MRQKKGVVVYESRVSVVLVHIATQQICVETPVSVIISTK